MLSFAGPGGDVEVDVVEVVVGGVFDAEVVNAADFATHSVADVGGAEALLDFAGFGDVDVDFELLSGQVGPSLAHHLEAGGAGGLVSIEIGLGIIVDFYIGAVHTLGAYVPAEVVALRDFA